MTDTVEKVVSDPPKRNNRIRTARYLNRNCVRGRDFESMLRIQGRKIVFQQYRPKADIRLDRHLMPVVCRFSLAPRWQSGRLWPGLLTGAAYAAQGFRCGYCQRWHLVATRGMGTRVATDAAGQRSGWPRRKGSRSAKAGKGIPARNARFELDRRTQHSRRISVYGERCWIDQ